MPIQVLIKRQFVPEKAQAIAPLMIRLRSMASTRPGYLSSRSLRCLEPCEDNEYLVISTWQSVKSWKDWLQSPERKAIQEEIDRISGEKTEYWIYEDLVGGIDSLQSG